MPPRRFKKKYVKRIVEKHVAKAIEEYEKTRVDSNNTGGSGSANTGGTVAPDVHGCSYKTFTNGKPHTFNGTEGVVGLKRWFEKMEQVFEICKCAEDDKVKFDVCTFEGRALTWWNRNVQTLGLANANQIPWSNEMTSEAYNNRFPRTVIDVSGVGVQLKSKRLKRTFRDSQRESKEMCYFLQKLDMHDAIKMSGNIEQGFHAKALRDRLELPQELSRVRHTFHVSNLKKYLSDEPLAIPLEEIHIDDKLNFVKEPVEIMDREVKWLKQSRFPIFKVRWNSRSRASKPGNNEDKFRNEKFPQLSREPAFHQVSRT
ncbi:hypothetical protein Tco_0575086 [Tanacetum coccineum]